MHSPLRAPAAIAGCLAALTFAPSASAQDIFEIQVYDSSVANPMRPGIETHINYTSTRETSPNEAGELPTDGVLRLTFEPHLGLTRWAEVGMYVVTAARPEGRYDIVGLKARLKLRWPERLLGGRLGLALNQEIGFSSRSYEAAVGEWELRPIIDFREGWFYASFNPMFGVELGGDDAGTFDFEPALKVSVSPLSWLAIGPEYYSGLGPLFSLAPVSQQNHWLFGAVDLSINTRRLSWDINMAVGHGLIGPDDWMAKVIVGVDLN